MDYWTVDQRTKPPAPRQGAGPDGVDEPKNWTFPELELPAVGFHSGIGTDPIA